MMMTRRYVTLSKWLTANSMPPPLLPSVCGYAPLARDVLKALKSGWGDEKPVPPRPPTGAAGARAGAASHTLGADGKTAAADAARAARKPDPIDDADSPAR